MQKEINIQVSPEQAADPALLKSAVSRSSGLPAGEIRHVEILKRSIDARQRKVRINLRVRIYVHEDFEEEEIELPDYPDVSKAREILIVGAGPAGLFAALKLIEKGFKPIVLERGKDVRARRRDLAAITRNHEVNPDSNYCFGEGGAGTYSDGKLYTRSKKRGDVNRILRLLIAHGANKNIGINAHPHIGTNKLPRLIQSIRETILRHGGEIQFNTRVTDLLLKESRITGVVTQSGDKLESDRVILATGHSARDIFELLHRKGIAIEAKPFALGVRVEHSQELIDSIQYHCEIRGPHLPPAPYSVVRQVGNRGVYSFCMCPGGVIAPCATAPGEVVTNGWSPSKRDLPTSNSGIVVSIALEDLENYKQHGPLMGLEFQKEIEQRAWRLAGETQRVPAQRLVDFTKGTVSASIPKTSYQPGTTSIEMGEVLPTFVNRSLQEGFQLFGQSMKGYLTNEAVVHAPESRTSSPIRIPRDPDSLQHVQVQGLYPCGEGAGYAGGIISAAIDGEKCAEQASLSLK
jgi:uncharacterized FAD-dependent dehydrogenase